MKKRKKKSTVLFAAILSAAVLWGNVPAAAAQTAMDPNIIVSDSNYLDKTSPRLKYLSSVFTDMTIRGNRADCQGNYTTFENVKVKLQVMLQKSPLNISLDSDWTKVESWDLTWTGPAQKILARSHTGLTPGYYYRVKTTATVLDGNMPLETVVVHSVVSYYGG